MDDVQQAWISIVTVVIAEANRLNCQLIENAFRQRRTRVDVIASAAGSAQALALVREREPDVAIISAELENGSLGGFHVLREMHSLRSKTRAILLLGSRERDLVIDAYRCGARGVVFRDEPLDTLAKCIHAVHRGQVWASSEHLGYLLDVVSHAKPVHLRNARGMPLLSKREAEVARLVADGMTNREISTQLGLSEHTVRNYLFKVFDKLGVSTRVELVLYCVQESQQKMSREEADEMPGKNGHKVA